MTLREAIDRSGSVPADMLARSFKAGRPPKVLCAIDLSSRSDAAVWRADAIARKLGAQMFLLHVVDLAKSARAIGRRRARARLILDAHLRRLAPWGSDAQIAVRAGRPHETIAEVAIEWDADLIVLGPYRRRLGDSFTGTTAERLVRKSERPVLVVNRESAGPYENVLLTSDLSRLSDGIARVTKQLGLLEGSRASVVHALQPQGGAMLHLAGVSESEVERFQRSLSQLAKQEIEAQLEGAGLNAARFSVFSPQTSPFRAIEQVAQRLGSDLVVIGSSRFPLLKRVFIGSVSNEVLRGIRHDVLLISPAVVQRARRRSTKVSHPSGRATQPQAIGFETSRDEHPTYSS